MLSWDPRDGDDVEDSEVRVPVDVGVEGSEVSVDVVSVEGSAVETSVVDSDVNVGTVDVSTVGKEKVGDFVRIVDCVAGPQLLVSFPLSVEGSEACVDDVSVEGSPDETSVVGSHVNVGMVDISTVGKETVGDSVRIGDSVVGRRLGTRTVTCDRGECTHLIQQKSLHVRICCPVGGVQRGHLLEKLEVAAFSLSFKDESWNRVKLSLVWSMVLT